MTSKLEDYLSKELYTRYGHLSIKRNYRPDWMEGLELDFYIEEMKIAAEVQGEQHYRFVEYFHRTIENFESQQNRDAKKSVICRNSGVKLYEIFTELDADLFVKMVGGYKEQHPKSVNIELKETQETVYQVRRAIKLAKRAIAKANGDANSFQRCCKKVAIVFKISKSKRVKVEDKTILEFYKLFPRQIDERL